MSQPIRSNSKHSFILENDHYPGDIIPDTKIEMWKTITLRGKTSIGGGIMGSSLDMKGGPCTLHQSAFIKEHAAFTLDEPGAVSLVKGCVQAEKTFLVTSPVNDGSARLVIEGDVYSDQVKIDHAFIYGNLFCNTAVVRDCVVLGGIYATTKVELERTVVGTIATRTAELGERVILLHPNAVTENAPEIREDLHFVFLNRDGSIRDGISMGREDVVKRIDQENPEELQRQFIEPRYVLGLGNRLLNIEMITELFLQNAAILSEKYLKNNSLHVDEEEAKQFEQAVFGYTRSVEISENLLTFDLEDYTLPPDFFEMIGNDEEIPVGLTKADQAVLELENVLGDIRQHEQQAAARIGDSAEQTVQFQEEESPSSGGSGPAE